jgi:hypothetical protein
MGIDIFGHSFFISWNEDQHKLLKRNQRKDAQEHFSK